MENHSVGTQSCEDIPSIVDTENTEEAVHNHRFGGMVPGSWSTAVVHPDCKRVGYRGFSSLELELEDYGRSSLELELEDYERSSLEAEVEDCECSSL